MVKNPPANARDSGLIPGSRRSPREGNGNPLQYSLLGNSMEKGAGEATVHGVTKSQMRLSDETTAIYVICSYIYINYIYNYIYYICIHN